MLNVFLPDERRLRETGVFAPVINNAGRPRCRRTAAAAAEENILRFLDRSPGTSTRRLAARHHMSQNQCGELYMKHYSTHAIYNLCKNFKEVDFERRRILFAWLIHENAPLFNQKSSPTVSSDFSHG
ncbi:hypothetical protein ANN_19022 [Periplaneta americana]|uniref:Uncharacterized protein n=1 Tax=Periplaneta americana TaxID=6978 RepID=A0ABQ8SQD3_PERAM|nr:hypothetical protein ANN_19022 [Periplaneta americana]